MKAVRLLAVVAGLAVAGPVAAQGGELLSRIEGVEDGWVALAYEVDEDVRICENGIHRRDHSWGSWSDGRRPLCSEGLAVLEFRVVGGEIREVELEPDVSDRITHELGLRGPAEVADALFTLAERTRIEEVAEDAIPAAVFARGVTTWPRVLEIARDRRRPEDVRSQAVFWLGQAAAEAATAGLAALAGDTEDRKEVREAAVFALSQRPSEEGTPILMELARTADAADVRRSALFWLAQSESPEVLDFFETLLRGG